MSIESNLKNIFWNYHDVVLKVLIILQDSYFLTSDPMDIKLKKELDYLYSNLKHNVKISFLNTKISSHNSYSESIKYIIEKKPEDVRLIFITSEKFEGEENQPDDLKNMFSSNDILFFKKEEHLVTRRGKTNLIDFLSEKKLIKVNLKKEVA